jgi:hypothetical protein
MEPGKEEIVWDGRTATGRDAAPGLYFYRIDSEDRTATGRIVRVR